MDLWAWAMGAQEHINIKALAQQNIVQLAQPCVAGCEVRARERGRRPRGLTRMLNAPCVEERVIDCGGVALTTTVATGGVGHQVRDVRTRQRVRVRRQPSHSVEPTWILPHEAQLHVLLQVHWR